jgi:hypothetical protein
MADTPAAQPVVAPATASQQQILAGTPVSQSQNFITDEVLWYNVGLWGTLGYAVPNFAQQSASRNSTILQLVQIVGRNLFAIMHMPDAQLRVPPSINVLTAMNALIKRARQILSSRALTPGQPRMVSVHGAPNPRDFTLYPVPYFLVPNAYMSEWCGLILSAIGEACQATENAIPYEISNVFAGQFGQYFQRIYIRLAVELFGVDPVKASDPAFDLTPMLSSYNPNAWFTSTEMIDTVPPLNQVPPGNDPRLQVLARGIAASQLLGLSSWPGGVQNPQASGTVQGTAAAPAPVATAPFTGAFVPPPGSAPA